MNPHLVSGFADLLHKGWLLSFSGCDSGIFNVHR